jgi:succinate dehydrogenase / fumarate reductase membrane anchor subunit
MSFKTDYGRVQGLGSAKDGTHHFWTQRLSAIALIILTPFFIIPLAYTLGLPHAQMLETYQHPFHAIVAALFILTCFYHLKLGLQTVIEDYTHGGTRTALIVFANLLCGALGFSGLFAVAKIAFSG